jgi:hypothetical protein
MALPVVHSRLRLSRFAWRVCLTLGVHEMSPRDSSNAQNRNQLGRKEGGSNVNPYASPSTVPSASQRAPFKPDWQARFFFMLARGGSRPAKRDSVTGELILSTSGRVLGFFLFYLLGAPTGIFIVALVDPPTPQEWWIPWVMGAGFLALGTLGIRNKSTI